MTYYVFWRLNLTPSPILFQDVVQIRRYFWWDGEPGRLDRLSYHELHRDRLSLRQTSETVREHPLSDLSGSRKTLFWYNREVHRWEDNSMCKQWKMTQNHLWLTNWDPVFQWYVDSKGSIWLWRNSGFGILTRTCLQEVMVYLHYIYSNPSSSRAFVFIQRTPSPGLRILGIRMMWQKRVGHRSVPREILVEWLLLEPEHKMTIKTQYKSVVVFNIPTMWHRDKVYRDFFYYFPLEGSPFCNPSRVFLSVVLNTQVWLSTWYLPNRPTSPWIFIVLTF